VFFFLIGDAGVGSFFFFFFAGPLGCQKRKVQGVASVTGIGRFDVKSWVSRYYLNVRDVKSLQLVWLRLLDDRKCTRNPNNQ
jgi:hypothetical protein